MQVHGEMTQPFLGLPMGQLPIIPRTTYWNWYNSTPRSQFIPKATPSARTSALPLTVLRAKQSTRLWLIYKHGKHPQNIALPWRRTSRWAESAKQKTYSLLTLCLQDYSLADHIHGPLLCSKFCVKRDAAQMLKNAKSLRRRMTGILELWIKRFIVASARAKRR